MPRSAFRERWRAGNHAMPTDPKAVILDLDKVSNVLWKAALAMSYDINSDMVMKDTEAFALKLLRVCYDYSPGLMRLITGPKGGSFSMELTVNDGKLARDAVDFYTLFCTRYTEACRRGPGPMIAYLTEKGSQTQRAIDNFRYKAQATEKVNEEVIQALNTGIDRAQRIKTLAEITMLLMGTFCPLTWVQNTLVGVGYAISVEVVKNFADVEGADLLCFGQDAQRAAQAADNLTSRESVANQGLGLVGNVWQDLAGDAVARRSYLSAMAHAESQRLLKMQETRLAGYLAQGGRITGQQGKRLAEGAARIAVAEEQVLARQAAMGGAKASLAAARSFSLLVGVYFLKDEIVKAWKGQTAWEQEQRQAAQHQEAR
jgi:uncharacterized membrane protein YccF (DUF307 family)